MDSETAAGDVVIRFFPEKETMQEKLTALTKENLQINHL